MLIGTAVCAVLVLHAALYAALIVAKALDVQRLANGMS